MSDNKKELVKAHFNNTQYYLQSNYLIRYRAKIVKELIGNAHFKNAIDIACGDGSGTC